MEWKPSRGSPIRIPSRLPLVLRSDQQQSPPPFRLAARRKEFHMMHAPALLRKALLLVSSAALFSVFSWEANAQNASASAGERCTSPTTIPCARAWMITDDQLREAVAVNSLPNHLEKIFSAFTTSDPPAYAAAKQRLAGILQHAESQSGEMGITHPVMYVSGLTTQAAQTREGKNFVFINKDAFRLAMLTDDGAERMRLSVSREFARIRNGDTSPAAMVKHHNDPAASREAGLRADLEGAGPLGAKNPIAAAAAIQSDMREELHKLVFIRGNLVDDLDPNRLSDRDYKRIADEHVRIADDIYTLNAWERIIALRKEARMLAEYEQTRAVRTHSDREAESKWLVEQVLRDTQCQIQRDPMKTDSQPCSQSAQAK
jgi:hypothetical protein